MTLNETDRILSCPFCRVRLFFSPGDYARYCLPINEKFSDEPYFVPYWRFKGMFFSCEGNEIKKVIIDTTALAFKKLPLAASLGLRPQAMELKFVTPDIKGKFLACDVLSDSIMQRTEDRSRPLNTVYAQPTVFHKACIGEILSMIYMPVFIEKSTVFDGILAQPLAALSLNDMKAFSACDEAIYSEMQFISALCPNCGWSLEGERDSIILGCGNCSSVWHISGSGLKRTDFAVIPGKGEGISYLPFWRIKAQVKGLELNSYADLIRLANLPKVIQKEWYDADLFFWVPAFKVHPDLLLRIGRFVTIAQLQEDLTGYLPKESVHPVTLPLTEAEECLKIILADIAIAKKKIFPSLKDVEIKSTETLLVYLPFTNDRDDLFCPQARLIIPKNALKYGRNL
ncbi:MAG: hypothetical protein NT010_06465 [Proteobacteria bacterium]|nr:hypothetical protein [Pseudomonadota bacterium]